MTRFLALLLVKRIKDPKTAQEGIKTTQRRPHESLRWFPDGPREPQNGSRGPPGGPREGPQGQKT
eukprot:1049622-Pyramimonas_sp.AAC.1